ncbi:MAG: HD domain-containing protein [Thermoguttaceae bacterium]|jgi:HD superfamily phosphohydrolase
MSNVNAKEILFIPEIAGLDARSSIIRVPPELDVPLTPRVRRIIDMSAFRRLANVSQLGFVRLVYPGATHTRFEHSLGVYRLSLLWLKRLAHDPRFTAIVREEDALVFILAALLHDVGHFPYCHLLEDLKIPGLASHEKAADEYILGELADPIRQDWGVAPKNVCDLLMKRPPCRRDGESDAEYERRKKVFHLFASILSGPIDVDKMDYLMRDSIGAGVPYGKNYDLYRLVGSVCLNEAGDGIAITNKGKTAAELMVFARYVMFSEVYWHHTARAATVMFQRAIHYLSAGSNDASVVDSIRQLSDPQTENYLLALCQPSNNATHGAMDDFERRAAGRFLGAIFGTNRNIFKRLREFTAMEAPSIYKRIAGRPYPEVCAISDRLAGKLGVRVDQILIDAPPVDKEVEFKIDVYFPQERRYRPLTDVSPVVKALAREQFDDCVKKVRIFTAPDVAPTLKQNENLTQLLEEALQFD